MNQYEKATRLTLLNASKTAFDLGRRDISEVFLSEAGSEIENGKSDVDYRHELCLIIQAEGMELTSSLSTMFIYKPNKAMDLINHWFYTSHSTMEDLMIRLQSIPQNP